MWQSVTGLLKFTILIYKTSAFPVAGFCGYLLGKMSYMKTCQEKFKRLENSPLGEALRQRTGLPSQQWVPHTHTYIGMLCCIYQVAIDHFSVLILSTKGAQSELSDPDTQSFETLFEQAETPSQRSYDKESAMQSGKSDDFSTPGILQSFIKLKCPWRFSVVKLKGV